MTLPVRSKSLKSSSSKRKNKNIQKRPKTWTCHPKRYTVSPRVSRWVSQHNNVKRQTIATISTLSSHTNSEATLVHFQQDIAPCQDIFHTQSLLFLFGFLFFPCWWVGGFCLKVNNLSALPAVDVEKRMTMHSSLIANGRTASRILRLPAASSESILMDTQQLFYVWNRLMSVVSIGLTLLMIGLLVWYYVGCHVSINGTCTNLNNAKWSVKQ